MGNSNIKYTLTQLEGIKECLDNVIGDRGNSFLVSKRYMLGIKQPLLRNKTEILVAHRDILNNIINYNKFSFPGYSVVTKDYTLHKQDGTTITISRTNTFVKKLGDKILTRQCDTYPDEHIECTNIYSDIIVSGNCCVNGCFLNDIISEIKNNIDSYNCLNC